MDVGAVLSVRMRWRNWEEMMGRVTIRWRRSAYDFSVASRGAAIVSGMAMWQETSLYEMLDGVVESGKRCKRRWMQHGWSGGKRRW